MTSSAHDLGHRDGVREWRRQRRTRRRPERRHHSVRISRSRRQRVGDGRRFSQWRQGRGHCQRVRRDAREPDAANAQASVLGADTGYAQATSTAYSYAGSVTAFAKSPVGGPASAETLAEIGPANLPAPPITLGETASYAEFTPGSPDFGSGAFSVGYGGTGELLTYEADADHSPLDRELGGSALDRPRVEHRQRRRLRQPRIRDCRRRRDNSRRDRLPNRRPRRSSMDRRWPSGHTAPGNRPSILLTCSPRKAILPGFSVTYGLGRDPDRIARPRAVDLGDASFRVRLPRHCRASPRLSAAPVDRSVIRRIDPSAGRRRPSLARMGSCRPAPQAPTFARQGRLRRGKTNPCSTDKSRERTSSSSTSGSSGCSPPISGSTVCGRGRYGRRARRGSPSGALSRLVGYSQQPHAAATTMRRVDVSVFRQPSNNSNGNTVDNQGRLVTCEHLTRRVTRTEFDGSISVLADKWQGKRLNSPNDVVVKSGRFDLVHRSGLRHRRRQRGRPCAPGDRRLPCLSHRSEVARSDPGDRRHGSSERPGVLARREAALCRRHRRDP